MIASLLIINLSAFSSAQCTENWQCTEWNRCLDSITERNCFDSNNCNTFNSIPSERELCKTIWPTCYNGIRDYDETDIDCGGKTCETCELKKSCFEDNDCKMSYCVSNKCSLKTEKPAPSAKNYWYYILIVLILMATAVFLTNKPKRKVILIPNKTNEYKEKRGKMVVVNRHRNTQRNERFGRFLENLRDYIGMHKPSVKINLFNHGKKKDLLNKYPYRKHPTKEFMIKNIKEAYHD